MARRRPASAIRGRRGPPAPPRVTVGAVRAAHENIGARRGGPPPLPRLWHRGRAHDDLPFRRQHSLRRAKRGRRGGADLALLRGNGQSGACGAGFAGDFHLDEAIGLCRAAETVAVITIITGFGRFRRRRSRRDRRRSAARGPVSVSPRALSASSLSPADLRPEDDTDGDARPADTARDDAERHRGRAQLGGGASRSENATTSSSAIRAACSARRLPNRHKLGQPAHGRAVTASRSAAPASSSTTP